MKLNYKKCFALSIIMAVTMMFCACTKEAELQPATADIEMESSTYAVLQSNNSKKFSYDDLTIGALSKGMGESKAKECFGEPTKVKEPSEEADSNNSVKVYIYEGFTVSFMKIAGQYQVIGMETTSVDNDITFARGIKLGDTKDKVIDSFYRDANCYNNNVMTEDNSTIIGKYLYGSYTMDELEKRAETQVVEYGIIDYNGNKTFEEAEEYFIQYTYFDGKYINGKASYNDDFAQIIFEINKEGTVKGIRWYYYPEISS